MRCENCGRLSPEDVNVCRFCGKVFDESKPAEKVEPNNLLAYEIEKKENTGKVPKYFKFGWLVIAAGIAVLVLIILLICGII